MLSKEEYARAVGLNIRKRRKELGLTISELAFRLKKIEPKQLGRIERGEINTTLYSLNQIALGLQITPDLLINLIDKDSN